MKIDKLKKRLVKNRPMVMVSIRIPEDVVSDLRRLAPLLGFSGYQALMKAYVGQGLRKDLERLEGSVEIPSLIDSLRKYGVNEEVISHVISETKPPYSTD